MQYSPIDGASTNSHIKTSSIHQKPHSIILQRNLAPTRIQAPPKSPTLAPKRRGRASNGSGSTPAVSTKVAALSWANPSIRCSDGIKKLRSASPIWLMSIVRVRRRKGPRLRMRSWTANGSHEAGRYRRCSPPAKWNSSTPIGGPSDHAASSFPSSRKRRRYRPSI